MTIAINMTIISSCPYVLHYFVNRSNYMKYRTVFCPHCHKSLGKVTGTPDSIGSPFKQCPWCGRMIIDRFTNEWVTKSSFDRFMFFIKLPLAASFISFLAFAGILTLIIGESLTNAILIGIVFGSLALSICIFIILYVKRKSETKGLIAKSIERTKSAKYVGLLRKANFDIYPIKGIEISSIMDYSEEYSNERDDIQEIE